MWPPAAGAEVIAGSATDRNGTKLDFAITVGKKKAAPVRPPGAGAATSDLLDPPVVLNGNIKRPLPGDSKDSFHARGRMFDRVDEALCVALTGERCQGI